MRKSKEETAKTRQKIVEVAATELRKNGIVSSGVADIMAAAGLTNGGFYKHFESKDELIGEASVACLHERLGALKAIASKASKTNGLSAILSRYLSTEHRDNPQDGCPFAALGSEMARATPKNRKIATDGFVEMVDFVASQYPGVKPAEAKKRALLAVCTMVGALTMARVATDENLSEFILSTAANSLKRPLTSA